MENIIAAIDFSSHSDGVLDSAAELAKKMNAKLWIIHVTSAAYSVPLTALENYNYCGTAQYFPEYPDAIIYDRELTAQKFSHEHRHLNALSAKLKADGLNVSTLLLDGQPSNIILAKASELKAKMIILASHGHGELHKIFLGSTCEKVLAQATCDILIIPAKKAEITTG